MKKLLALMLCAMLLLGAFAVAEEALDPALVNHISNIAIEVTGEGANTINLEGFEAFLTIDTADGLALVAQAYNGDDPLALAVAKLEGTQLKVAIDGVDKTYVADIPQLAGQDLTGLGEAVRGALPVLLNMTLPAINVGSLPKLDLVPLVSMLGSETEGDTTTFAIPAEIVDMVLDQLIEAVKGQAGSVPGLDQGLEMIEQLRASGNSIALAGKIVDAGDSQTTTLEIYPVSNGQTAPDAIAVLTLNTVQDALTLAVDVSTGEELMTIANLSIETEAATNSCVATMDIAGMMQFNLAVFQEDGLQKVALTMDSGYDAGFGLTLTYGKSGNGDLIDITFAVGGETAFEVVTNSTAISDKIHEGNIEITVATGDQNIHAAADVEEFLSSIDLGDFTMPAETAPIEELESDESLQNALTPLIGYFSQIAA